MALLLGWTALAAYLLTRVAADIRAAERSVELARAQAGAEPDFASAGGHLRRASDRLAKAHDRVRSPVIAPLRVLPVVGRQVRSLDALTGEGARVGSVLTTTLIEAETLLKQAGSVRTDTDP